MQRVDSDKLKHYLRDDVYAQGVDDLLAAGSDEGGISERFAGPSAFSSLPAETSSMLAANNSNQGTRQGESTGALGDARHDAALSKMLPPMPQFQRPEHLLVTSEQGNPNHSGVDGPRPVHKAAPIPALTHFPLLNPMGSSELLSSLPEGNSGMAQLPMPPAGSLPSGPSVDSSGLLKASGTASQSKSLPRNGNSGSERFCLERVAQQHVLDLAVDNLSPPGSPRSRDRPPAGPVKGARVKSSEARGPAGLGPVTQLHRGGSLTNPPQVNSRATHTSGPTDDPPAANPTRAPAAPPDQPSPEEADPPSVQLPPKPATHLPARSTTHLPARPSTQPVAPLAIPSSSQSLTAAHSGGTAASTDPGTSPCKSALPPPGSDAPSVHSSSAASTKSRLRAPSATSTSMLPSPGGEPSPSGSMLTPRGGQAPLQPGSRIPRSPAEASSAGITPVRASPSLHQTPPSRLSPSQVYRSRLPLPNGGKSPSSMLPSRSGSVSGTSKASASPEFVAPRPRATILRAPSPGKPAQTLRTTNAELDKLAATLKQVQHDISMSLPQSASHAEGTPQPPAAARDRGARRSVWQEVEADAQALDAPRAVQRHEKKDAAGRPGPERLNSEASEAREPLAEVTNGTQAQGSASREHASVAPDPAGEQGEPRKRAEAAPPSRDAGAADADPARHSPAADAAAPDAAVDADGPTDAVAAAKARRKKRREHGKGGGAVRHKSSKKTTSSSRAKAASSSNNKKPKPKDLPEPSPPPPPPPPQRSNRWCCFA